MPCKNIVMLTFKTKILSLKIDQNHQKVLVLIFENSCNHNSQYMETTWMAINGWMYKENMYIYR